MQALFRLNSMSRRVPANDPCSRYCPCSFVADSIGPPATGQHRCYSINRSAASWRQCSPSIIRIGTIILAAAKLWLAA